MEAAFIPARGSQGLKQAEACSMHWVRTFDQPASMIGIGREKEITRQILNGFCLRELKDKCQRCMDQDETGVIKFQVKTGDVAMALLWTSGLEEY